MNITIKSYKRYSKAYSPKGSTCYIQYNMFLLFNTSFYLSKLMAMNKKLTYRYAFTLLKMKHAEGRNEYIDLAQEANLLWHQIVSQKAKTRSK